MEAISANEIAIRVVPTPAKIQPYTIEAGPPFRSESCIVAPAPVQEHNKTKEKFIVVIRLIHFSSVSCFTELIVGCSCNVPPERLHDEAAARYPSHLQLLLL